MLKIGILGVGAIGQTIATAIDAARDRRAAGGALPIRIASRAEVFRRELSRRPPRRARSKK